MLRRVTQPGENARFGLGRRRGAWSCVLERRGLSGRSGFGAPMRGGRAAWAARFPSCVAADVRAGGQRARSRCQGRQVLRVRRGERRRREFVTLRGFLLIDVLILDVGALQPLDGFQIAGGLVHMSLLVVTAQRLAPFGDRAFAHRGQMPQCALAVILLVLHPLSLDRMGDLQREALPRPNAAHARDAGRQNGGAPVGRNRANCVHGMLSSFETLYIYNCHENLNKAFTTPTFMRKLHYDDVILSRASGDYL